MYARGARPLDVCEICPDREQPEETAQNLFPFRDPNDRFDVERMDGKQERHECAAPARSGHPLQD